jgi:hypothetical protein
MATTAAEWLKSNRNYSMGLEILRSAGISDFMLEMLSEGPDTFNTPQLLQEIEKLSAAYVATDKELDLPIPIPDDTEGRSATGDISNHNLEKKMCTDAMIRELWKEICHLHGQLAILPEGDQLYQVANLLLVKEMKKTRLWNQLHYFTTNGHWFDELPENQPKPEDLEQEIKNAMSNRAKAKKKLKEPLQVAKKEYYSTKVAEWDVIITNLKLQRDGK